MISTDQLVQLRDILQSVNSVAVLIQPNSSLDILSAASSLFLSLQAMGKDVIFAGPSLPNQSTHNLVGFDQLRTSLGNRNLTVSFDYTETAVDKVSYHIGEDSQKFFLTIKPQKNQAPLDSSTVEFSYTGSDAQLLLLVGVSDYESLEQLYYGNEQLYEDATVVAINSFESDIGHLQLSTAGSDSLSTAMAQLIQQLEMTIPSDAATNLLFGIEETTDSFRSLATKPETFEVVAWLMRMGARRVRKHSGVGKGVVPANQISAQNLAQNSAQQQPPNEGTQQFAEVFSKVDSRQPSQEAELVQSPPARQSKKKRSKGKVGGLDHQPGLTEPSR